RQRKRKRSLSAGFFFLFFEIGSGADPHPPAGARGRMAVGVSACPQFGTRIPGLGSLAGWLLGLMAMRWPGSRGRIWSGRRATKPTGGQIMKRLNKARIARAKLLVVAARDRAIETAQQHAVPSMKRPPTVLQRRRLAERLVSAKS